MISENGDKGQGLLFPRDEALRGPALTTTNFVANMCRPVHRWFRYSAGFSAEWAESVIRNAGPVQNVRVFDPFAGSATTLIAAQTVGAESWGLEAHPFVYRIAQAKLAWRSDPDAYQNRVLDILRRATNLNSDIEGYPQLIRDCYENSALERLDMLRRAYELLRDDTPASELAWLTLITILRKVSRSGTAQWQYVLPKKEKHAPREVFGAFREASAMVYADMKFGQRIIGPTGNLTQDDARTCLDVPRGFANLIVTSPPYPNNFDYADATRLEMSFTGEVRRWADLHRKSTTTSRCILLPARYRANHRFRSGIIQP